MRKAARLFEIIQILRLATRPVTAAEIAGRLEVTPRSVYRDIAVLQGMRVPIAGERGLGYILRPGFDLPPLMFSIEETEAIVLALSLLKRIGDRSLSAAAERVSDKVAGAVPPPLRRWLTAGAFHAWGSVMPSPEGVDVSELRKAIRDEREIFIVYRDDHGRETERVIRPAALVYYSAHSLVVAWCTLRDDLRNFRTDRIVHAMPLDTFFRGEGEGLRKLWTDGWENRPAG